MQLATIDWIIIISYCLISLGIGIFFSKLASRSVNDFFLSGRSLPWWLAGTSMVATSFATDAPLAATKLVREQGLAGLWFPLSWVFADLLTLFFFAKLWSRAKVTTDAEISELRYSGKSASILRLFNGLYSAIPLNCIIMGWVTLAMVKIMEVSLGWPKEVVIPILVGITVIYAVLSGLWGVVVTDLIQFTFATIGSIALAIIAVKHVGGISVLKSKVAALPSFSAETFNFWPNFGSAGTALTFFIVVMAVQWWAQKNVAGGGQLTQRMFACRSEKDSMLSVLWFTFAHYVLRPWPWMIVALVSLIIWPNLADNEAAYPKMIVELLPAGLRGIMVASLVAAFMSTIDTHLNWGASYIVVDVYKRFIKTDQSNKHYVWASRISVILLTVVAGTVAYFMDTILGAWKFLATVTAGVGPVFILRWYWWRINAWSELAALIASGFFSIVCMFIPLLNASDMYPARLLIVLGLTTITWLIVTFLTKPVEEEVLIQFYKKVRPSSFGWRKIAKKANLPESQELISDNLWAYICACIFIVSSLFSIGKWTLGFYGQAFSYTSIALVTGVYVIQYVVRQKNERKKSTDDEKIQSEKLDLQEANT